MENIKKGEILVKTNGKLLNLLEELAEKYPKSVIEQLDKGMKVQKSFGLKYIIDDIDIYKKLGNFQKGAVPYSRIHKYLRNSQSKIINLFKDSSEIPFSKAYNAEVGECLEKAILVQLSAQKGRPSFLIKGYIMGADGITGVHSYNVVFKDEKPFLVDAQNPLYSNGKIIPYIVPILDIEGKYGDLVVPKEFKQGRMYSVF